MSEVAPILSARHRSLSCMDGEPGQGSEVGSFGNEGS